mmetsp:Transcript_34759/g.86219  ORF Transcript_34759/g.86219 Transcript_34759/m.86219 type:complete len:122 (-) Transcript_34759:333-698(-)
MWMLLLPLGAAGCYSCARGVALVLSCMSFFVRLCGQRKRHKQGKRVSECPTGALLVCPSSTDRQTGLPFNTGEKMTGAGERRPSFRRSSVRPFVCLCALTHLFLVPYWLTDPWRPACLPCP